MKKLNKCVSFFGNWFLIKQCKVFFNWANKWLLSINHKDIGILCLLFGTFLGIVGTTLSIQICLESVFLENQTFNDILYVAHAFVMVLEWVSYFICYWKSEFFIPIWCT